MESPRLIIDDGLHLADVGGWAAEKYKLVALYATMFSRAMRRKWPSLTYIDLFAGSGRCRLGDSGRIALTSPTTVLGLSDRFDRYIFCESASDVAAALRVRAARDFPDRTAHILCGDANALLRQILDLIPAQQNLAFCFADPYKLANLHFDTIEQLATRKIDFLVLIPSGMDANRNKKIYCASDNRVVERFCGQPDWRSRWEVESAAGKSFERFIVEEFGRAMKRIGYIEPGLQYAQAIRSDEKNLLLYRLVLYSRHRLGEKFWKETQKYATPQIDLGF
jgi:three-Cys-motif partner protein